MTILVVDEPDESTPFRFLQTSLHFKCWCNTAMHFWLWKWACCLFYNATILFWASRFFTGLPHFSGQYSTTPSTGTAMIIAPLTQAYIMFCLRLPVEPWLSSTVRWLWVWIQHALPAPLWVLTIGWLDRCRPKWLELALASLHPCCLFSSLSLCLSFSLCFLPAPSPHLMSFMHVLLSLSCAFEQKVVMFPGVFNPFSVLQGNLIRLLLLDSFLHTTFKTAITKA